MCFCHGVSAPPLAHFLRKAKFHQGVKESHARVPARFQSKAGGTLIRPSCQNIFDTFSW